MHKSRFGPCWYREFDNFDFIIDLRSWVLGVRFGTDWDIHFLCFHLMGN